MRTDGNHAPLRVRRLIFVDHSGAPGGGQLGLGRYLAQPSAFHRTAVFIADGEIAHRPADSAVEKVILNPGVDHSRSTLLRSIPRLRSLLRHLDDDDAVIISNSGYASLALALAGLPRKKLISYLRTQPTPPESSRLKRWFDGRIVYGRFAGYLANSRWTQRSIPPSLSRRPSRVAYPLSGLLPADSAGRTQALADVQSIRIASFSRLDRWKGLDTLLDAAELLAARDRALSITVDIFGGSHDADPAYAESLRARISDAPFTATLHGHVSDVSVRMRAADIVVVPSLQPEPFGQVVAQALSHGCVTIVSNQGGAIEQIQDGANGLVFEPGDAVSLADALARVIDEPGLAQKLTADARRYGDSMSDPALASAFDDAVTELMDELKRS